MASHNIMEEFGSIEDDYIDLNEKSDVIDERNYKAFHCEPGWFLLVNKYEPELSQPIIKFKADYHYVKGNFKEAIELYYKYITEYENISLTIKRECLEGLSRSYLALNCYCYALKYAYKFDEFCSTFESYSAGYNLLFDCSMSARKYGDAVMYCMKLVTLHCLNSDTWLKLGCALGGLYKIPLFVSHLIKLKILIDGSQICFSNEYFSIICECKEVEVPTIMSCQDSKKGIYLIVMCLLHAEYLLKSVVHSASGFAVKQNLHLQDGILKDIESFDYDLNHLRLLRENVKKKHLGIRPKYDKEHSTEKYEERENSQFTNKEHIHCVLEINVKDFEKNWLFFDHNESKSIKYYI